MKEWLKFALALIGCLAILVLVFALAIYCRNRSEGDAILPLPAIDDIHIPPLLSVALQ